MKLDSKHLHIGIFDSGMGGISVLSDIISLMPNEKYIYYGDSKNAPYGIKSNYEVTELSFKVCDFLISKGVKSIVIACNTATSAAIKELRSKYDIPIIGMEPAIKPALNIVKEKKIAVMATPMTLSEIKFNNLLKKLTTCDKVIKIPAPELVEFVEKGIINDNIVKDQIKKYFENVDLSELGVVVLGCTHFVFLKDIIKEVIGSNIKIIDGNQGTAKHLMNTLLKLDLLNDDFNNNLEVKIYNSSNDPDMMELSEKLLNKQNFK